MPPLWAQFRSAPGPRFSLRSRATLPGQLFRFFRAPRGTAPCGGPAQAPRTKRGWHGRIFAARCMPLPLPGTDARWLNCSPLWIIWYSTPLPSGANSRPQWPCRTRAAARTARFSAACASTLSIPREQPPSTIPARRARAWASDPRTLILRPWRAFPGFISTPCANRGPMPLNAPWRPLSAILGSGCHSAAGSTLAAATTSPSPAMILICSAVA